MILNDEEVEQRLNHPSNLVNVITDESRSKKEESKLLVLPQPKNNQGRKEGDTQIPDRVRDLLGMMRKNSTGPSREIAEVMDVSADVINKTARGLVGNEFDPKLAERLDSIEEKNIEDAHGMALNLMMESMKVLLPRLKEDSIKPKDLSRIATDMSRITANIKPKDRIDGPRVQVVLFAPNVHTEKEYESIDV